MSAKRLLLILLIFHVVAAIGIAQVTTGGIRGVISDSDGKPVPGANVTIKSESMIGSSRTTQTNELGVFRFPSLPVGEYSLEATLEGFKTVSLQKIQVGLDQTANVPLTMSMSSMEENVNVVGEAPLIDVTQAGLSTNYSKELLEEVPTQRSFTDLMQVSPGISASLADSNGDRTVAFGSNQQSNSWNVDGLETTAPETGSVWISQNPDAIEEIQVIGVGAPAEYGNHTGAVFNVVTKKGGNNYHGGVNYFLQSDSLTGTNVVLDDVSGEAAHFNRDKYHDFNVNVGGPIKKDRLWFYGSYENNRDASTDPGNAPQFATTGKDDRYNMKLTTLMGHNQVTGFYQYNKWFSPDPASPFITPSAVYQERGTDDAWGATMTSTISESFLFEAGYAGWRTHDLHDSITGSTDDPFVDYSPPDGGPTLQSGGALYPFDYKTSRHQGNAKATYYSENFLKSQHEFRFGVQYAHGDAATLVAAGFNGFYDYHYGDYQYRAYQLPFNYGAITNDTGIFLDDTITVNDRLTINAGVRFDHNVGTIPQYAILSIGTPSITPTVGNFIDTGQTTPSVDVMTWNKVSPRLGFVYQVADQGKSVLQGSFGVYYDHNVSGNWDYPSPSATAFTVKQFNPDTGQFDIPVYEIAPGDISFDPNLQPPRTLQYSVGYEQQIKNDSAFGVQYIYKTTKDLIGWDIEGGLWAPHPFTDPFTGAQYTLLDLVENPVLRKGNSPGNFCDHIVGGASASMCSDDLSNYWQKYHGVILTYNKRFDKNWAINASYTWSKSTGLIPRMLSQVQFNPFYSSLEGSDPNNYVNATGRLQGDRPNMFRVQGVFSNLPLGIQASASLDFSSGNHHVRAFREGFEQGSQRVIMERDLRFSSIKVVDLTFGRKFAIGGSGANLRLEGTIFNLLNSDNELEMADITLSEGETFVPDLWTKPRRLQVRIGMQF